MRRAARIAEVIGFAMSSLAVAGLVACSDEKNDTFADGARGGSASGTAGTTQTGGTTGGSAMGGNAGDVSGAGGSGATAGSGASAGAAGSGNPGGAGSGGSGPGGATSGGSAGSGGAAGGTPVSCTITASSVMSSAIATVGIVTFSTDLAGLTSARIEFGPTTSYGMTAPVNFAQPNYRTLLIGMKPSRMYHYRVVARAGQNECTGPDATLMTGTLNNVPTITRMTNDAAALAGGFLVGSQPQGGTAFILDADGDVVWLYSGGGASRVHMSADSQHLWLLATNQGGGGPNVRRIGMDGMGTIEMHTEFGDAHHDFVVLPDDTVGFLQYYMGGRDRVMERAPDGTVRQIIDIPTAHGGTTNNHANSIQYFATDDSYTVSDLDQNCYVKFSRQGEVAWVLGGDTSEFTGPGATWTREHGHHLLAPNRLLFFNNGSMGSDAVIREVTLDLTAMTAANTWQYEGGESSQTLGDAQRLWNGNTLATYSNSSIIHEVSPSGELVESLRFTGGLGYTNKRQSLYGPPSRQTGQ